MPRSFAVIHSSGETPDTPLKARTLAELERLAERRGKALAVLAGAPKLEPNAEPANAEDTAFAKALACLVLD